MLLLRAGCVVLGLAGSCSALITSPPRTFPRSRTFHRTVSAAESTTENSIDNDVLDLVLQVAIDASKKAGDIIIGNSGGVEVMERKANSRDLLTLIDPLCEKVRSHRANEAVSMLRF